MAVRSGTREYDVRDGTREDGVRGGIREEVVRNGTREDSVRCENTSITDRKHHVHLPFLSTGANDRKHISIQKQGLLESAFYNYKGDCSVLLMAVAHADYRFKYVHVGVFGGSTTSSSSIAPASVRDWLGDS